MSKVAYVNGRYVLHRDAMIHIEDRGYQFADGVYEVCEVFRGFLIDEKRHFERLAYSLAELQIAAPLRPGALAVVIREIMAKNRIENGFIYVQVTRGVALRDHVFPPQSLRPSLVVTGRQVDPEKSEITARKGINVIVTPDLRWKRVDIKSISLLPNVLARQLAREHGAYEAWLVNSEGMITEGAASNAWIINEFGSYRYASARSFHPAWYYKDHADRNHPGERPEAGGKKIQPRRGFRRTRGLRHRSDNSHYAGCAH